MYVTLWVTWEFQFGSIFKRFDNIPFNLMHGLQRLIPLYTLEAKIKWRKMGFSAWLVIWFGFIFEVCLFVYFLQNVCSKPIQAIFLSCIITVLGERGKNPWIFFFKFMSRTVVLKIVRHSEVNFFFMSYYEDLKVEFFQLFCSLLWSYLILQMCRICSGVFYTKFPCDLRLHIYFPINWSGILALFIPPKFGQ